MAILRKLGNLLFANKHKRYRQALLDPEKFANMRWECLQNVSDRYKKLGFFPLPLNEDMYERHQVFLEPSDALREQYLSEDDPRDCVYKAEAGWNPELEELEKPKVDRDDFFCWMVIKYARYEPTKENI